MSDPNSILFGNDAPTFKFSNVGDEIAGTLVSWETTTVRELIRQRDGSFLKGEVRRYPSGEEIQGVVMTLETNLRDAEKPWDDGQRRVFLESKNAKDALKAAVNAAGLRKVEPGAYLTVKYSGDGKKQGAATAPKLYECTYKPPAADTTTPDDDESPF